MDADPGEPDPFELYHRPERRRALVLAFVGLGLFVIVLVLSTFAMASLMVPTPSSR